MSRNITRYTEVVVHPSAYELAEAFWEMDAEEQAGFFHRLAEVSGSKLPFQLQALIENKHFTAEARATMQMIGDYGHSQEVRP